MVCDSYHGDRRVWWLLAHLLPGTYNRYDLLFLGRVYPVDDGGYIEQPAWVLGGRVEIIWAVDEDEEEGWVEGIDGERDTQCIETQVWEKQRWYQL